MIELPVGGATWPRKLVRATAQEENVQQLLRHGNKLSPANLYGRIHDALELQSAVGYFRVGLALILTSMPGPSPLTAFVLAGGKSTRMGSDKALMRLGGQPLIIRALALAKMLTDEVNIVGDPEKFGTFGKAVQDIYAARGPLGGIHAALRHSTTDHNLILGVDLPFVTSSFLSFLVLAAKSSNAMVTLPSSGGYLQTLCAIYRKEFFRPAESALAAGRNKIDALFPDISVRVIDEPEILAAGFNIAMFRNLNTPEDWRTAEREFETHPQHL